ncbi:hypothetical protein [Streptomyces sp. NRRL F-5123]|uniref:hypothetical protein n=1 Tax=Streptomyces sp. NRRL F-5123 TaxID=1463856 RepID=UPI000A83FD5A|nr:hypothetical protein [Streptomyces sp. NRRL F-5123]
MVPLAEAFPEQVGSGSGAYTKVAAATMTSCTEPDLVGPRLIGMIGASAGCVGEETALYKDAHNNQFSLAAFTMKDPVDTVKLVTELTMAFDDYEVAVQAPPPGSGLRILPADSGLVQSFTGQGRTMVVGLAQWSDGRVGDYQTLGTPCSRCSERSPRTSRTTRTRGRPRGKGHGRRRGFKQPFGGTGSARASGTAE